MKLMNKLFWGIGLGIFLPGLASADILKVEAESATRGSAFVTGSDTLVTPAVNYITINVDGAGQAPGTADKVATFALQFPAAGEYDLYARLRNGVNEYNDDSFFYSNGFGSKDVNDADAWILANGIAAAGYLVPEEVVGGGVSTDPGSKHEVWKWIKLSAFDGGEPPVTFIVPDGELNQTFQIGGREDGLDFDKFVFAPVGSEFTVQNLDDGVSPVTPPTDTPPIADGQEKYLGNIHSTSQILNFTSYWNQVAPENAGKWGSVEGKRDEMTWAQLDAAYNLAKNNGLPFRMHVMIWGNQQPAWIESLPPEEQLAEITEWFDAVSARYSDIDIVEIVNEPVNDAPAGATNGNYIEALGGTGETGWDWVIAAFELGRTYFPNSKLMLNEYSVTNGSYIDKYMEIVDLLQERDLIDALGVQAHSFSTQVAASVTKANLDRLAETGLPIYVTEMDIDSCANAATNPNSDAVQLANYQRIFPTFWEHPGVEGVTLWGWRPGLWRDEFGAALVNQDGSERLALTWLRDYIESGEVGTITAASCEAASSSSSSNSSSAFSAPSMNISTKKTGGGSINMLLLVSLMIVAAGARRKKISA